jgi:hypothetical protein
MSSIFEPISDNAYNQIGIRQTKISQEFRDNETIAWLNSNGAFIRLKSSIDIIDETIKTKLGYPDDQPYDLASRYTLQGGTYNGKTFTDPNNSIYPLKSGIEGSTNPPAYGFENSILGLKPMPGIEKVSIKTVGEGYLREATINIRVNSPEQLNIIDVLYFRIGYSVLLEWGHTAYFDNDKNFTSGYFNEIVLADKSKDNILKEIEEKRAQSGYNYDAMFGVIENFQWDFRDDGGYDVTLKVISTGDIVDSLKINSTPLIENIDSTKEESSIFEKQLIKTKLHSWLVPLLYYSGNIKLESNFITRLIGYLSNNPFLRQANISTNTFLFSEVDITEKVKLSDTNNNDISDLIGYILDITKFSLPISSNIKNNPEYNELLVYGGVDKDIKIGSRAPGEFSDSKYYPTEYGSYIKLGLLFDLINNLFLYGDDNGKIQELETNLDSTKIFIHPYSVSPDPSICLYYNSKLTSNSIVLDRLLDKKFIESNTTYTGNLLRIHVNIRYVLDILEQQIDPKGNLSLKSFLTSLLQGIDSCVGNLNKFQIISQIDNNGKEKIKILSLFNDPSQTEDIQTYLNKTLEIFGYKTLFHNISLSSELTNDVSSIAAISAQAGPSNLDVNSEGGDIFSYLNKGVKDRIIPKKIIKTETTTEPSPSQQLTSPTFGTSQTFTTKQEQAINSNTSTYKTSSETKRKGNLQLYREYIELLYSTSPRETLPKTPLDIQSAKSTLQDLIKDELSTNLSSSGKSVIIPINLSFTMQGFSGFKLFNSFTIPIDFLPFSYKDEKNNPKFKFIISGINHEISLNKWDTSITTYMGPLLTNSSRETQPIEPYIGLDENSQKILTNELEKNRATIYSADTTNVATPILRENLTFITDESIDDTLNRIINQ